MHATQFHCNPIQASLDAARVVTNPAAQHYQQALRTEKSAAWHVESSDVKSPSESRSFKVCLSPSLIAKTNAPGQRATNKGFLPDRLKAYLKLLDWTGRQIRDDKRGSIPSHLQPILDRLQINGDVWVETVKEFGRKFRRAAGSPDSLAAEAARQDSNWLQGTRNAATVFG